MDALLADIVVVLHLAIVVFMIGGLAAILVGWPLRWSWIRRPWWRCAHIAIMAYIAFNAVRGELCFLTIWESALRERAGQYDGARMSFIGRLFRELLYVEVPQRSLNAIYLVFGGAVLASVLLVRPRFRRAPPRAD